MTTREKMPMVSNRSSLAALQFWRWRKSRFVKVVIAVLMTSLILGIVLMLVAVQRELRLAARDMETANRLRRNSTCMFAWSWEYIPAGPETADKWGVDENKWDKALSVSVSTTVPAQATDLPMWLENACYPVFGYECFNRILVADLSPTHPNVAWQMEENQEADCSGLNAYVNQLDWDLVGTLTQLRDLTIEFAKVEGDDPSKLQRLKHIERLCFRHCEITEDGFVAIGQLPSLKALKVDSCVLCDATLVPLRHAQALRSLTVYPLYEEPLITDQGMHHIARISTLVRLVIISDRITNDGVWAMQDLPQLEWLDVFSVKLTSAVGRSAKKRFPRLKILVINGDPIIDIP